MNQYDEKLAHHLKIKFGLAPNHPNQEQLSFIKTDINNLVSRGITPTYEQWHDIIKKYCPEIGTHHYLGLDNSDLITLMYLATKK
ncbi:hypothetical protein [Neisseria bacilliformis]|jgi:hypothetical protein|uniref:hypothetical protein n=1 Tax=Neisseria bacilliformis TaxID=267212 RepID=UPI0009E1EDD8|nr:hypothetical protein [Neisseria bacilliformis]